MIALFSALNTVSPLAVIALLGYIIYMQVQNQKDTGSQLVTITDNHLHELPSMMDTLYRVADTLQRMETAQASAFSTIIARLNGGYRG